MTSKFAWGLYVCELLWTKKSHRFVTTQHCYTSVNKLKWTYLCKVPPETRDECRTEHLLKLFHWREYRIHGIIFAYRYFHGFGLGAEICEGLILWYLWCFHYYRHKLKWTFLQGLTREICENKTTTKITTYTVYNNCCAYKMSITHVFHGCTSQTLASNMYALSTWKNEVLDYFKLVGQDQTNKQKKKKHKSLQIITINTTSTYFWLKYFSLHCSWLSE